VTKMPLAQLIKHNKNQVFISGNIHSLKPSTNEK
jgi:hypothetical protein